MHKLSGKKLTKNRPMKTSMTVQPITATDRPGVWWLSVTPESQELSVTLNARDEFPLAALRFKILPVFGVYFKNP